MPQAKQPKQPVTDDSIQVRQLSHYQFTWIAGEPGAPGAWTLQLVLDQGAWEEVAHRRWPTTPTTCRTCSPTASVVHYDVRRRTLYVRHDAGGQRLSRMCGRSAVAFSGSRAGALRAA